MVSGTSVSKNFSGNESASTYYPLLPEIEYSATSEIRGSVDGLEITNGVDFTVNLTQGVQTTVAYGTGQALTFWRDTPLTQETDFDSTETPDGDVLEGQLDRTVRQVQEATDQADRAFSVPPGETAPDLPKVDNREGRYPHFADTTGDMEAHTYAQVAANLAAELSIVDGAVADKGIKTFASAAARGTETPAFTGQLGVQLDTGRVYRANSLTSGDWSLYLTGTTSTSAANRATLTPSAEGELNFQTDEDTLWAASGTSVGDFDTLVGSAAWDGTGSPPTVAEGGLITMTGWTLDGWNGVVLQPGDQLVYSSTYGDETYKSLNGYKVVGRLWNKFTPASPEYPFGPTLDYRNLEGIVFDLDPLSLVGTTPSIVDLVENATITGTDSGATDASITSEGALATNDDDFINKANGTMSLGFATPGNKFTAFFLIKRTGGDTSPLQRVAVQNSGGTQLFGIGILNYDVGSNGGQRVNAYNATSGVQTISNYKTGNDEWVACALEHTVGTSNNAVQTIYYGGGSGQTTTAGNNTANLTHIRIDTNVVLKNFAIFDRHFSAEEREAIINGLYASVAGDYTPCKLFAVMGQSNGEGRQNNTETGTAAESVLGDPSSVSLPDSISGVYGARAMSLGVGGEGQASTHVSCRWFTPYDGIRGTDTGYSDGAYLHATDNFRWGIDIPFLDKLHNTYESSINHAWICGAFTGKGWVRDLDPNLAPWSNAQQAERGIRHFTKTLRGQGANPLIGGLILMGGETDAQLSETKADVKASIHRIVEQYRVGFRTDNFPVYICLIKSVWGTAGANLIVRTALAEVAQELPNAVLIPTEDAEILSDLTGSDTHFSASGFKTIGQRLADYAAGRAV